MKRLLRASWIATLLLVGLGVLVSSAFPDGLERVAEALGFAGHGSGIPPRSPFAGYATRYFHSHWAAQASAGLLGILLLYAFGVLFGRSLKSKKHHASRHSG